ncbi:MAG TPA: hypothetical protein VF221_09880 [Chloroflexota bacterium]
MSAEDHVVGHAQGRPAGSRRGPGQYASSVIVCCELWQALELCDAVAKEQHYELHSSSSNDLCYGAMRAHGRKAALPLLNIHLAHESGETTITVSSAKRSRWQRFRGPKVSVRAEVIVFRDQVWFHAARKSLSARVTE